VCGVVKTPNTGSEATFNAPHFTRHNGQACANRRAAFKRQQHAFSSPFFSFSPP